MQQHATTDVALVVDETILQKLITSSSSFVLKYQNLVKSRERNKVDKVQVMSHLSIPIPHNPICKNFYGIK